MKSVLCLYRPSVNGKSAASIITVFCLHLWCVKKPYAWFTLEHGQDQTHDHHYNAFNLARHSCNVTYIKFPFLQFSDILFFVLFVFDYSSKASVSTSNITMITVKHESHSTYSVTFPLRVVGPAVLLCSLSALHYLPCH